MTTNLLLSAIALLVGLIVFRLFTNVRGRRAITTADLAVVLSAAEIVQLLYTLTSVGVELPWAGGAIVPILCLIGIALVAVGSFVSWIGMLVTGLGVLAALTDMWLKDDPLVATMFVLLVALLSMINRLVRLITPW
ncbi:MAG: hypothetical protein JWO79_1266 [Actinomycetia bacterium]|nr:hypothetical protein [Actinomycetes bacterium]